MQLDRYVILSAGQSHPRRALCLALARAGWEAVVAREWPTPAMVAESASIAPGDVVLAWKADSRMAVALRTAAMCGDAATLLFLNYDEQAEGARLADALTGAAAQAVCPEYDGGDAVLWNVQPHGGRDLFFCDVAACLAGLGQGSVVDPYEVDGVAAGRQWRRLVPSSLYNPSFDATSG